jgi:hypothetical protein
MVLRLSKRHRIAAGVALTAVAASTVLISTGLANAVTSTTVAITSVSPHIVASGSANQVIIVTGKGFDQSTITSVAISGTGACTTSPDFIVVSATSLALKTVGTDCAAGASTITITDASGTATNTGVTAAALSFAAPPTLATVDASHNAVVTDNTSALAFADQALTAPIGGGTVIRVIAGATPFVTSTGTPLTASLGGVALTTITLGAGGAYFTGKVGAHAAGAAVLSVTSGGVTKSFTAAQTNNFSYAGSTITVTPASGPANGGGTLTIAGTGFVAGATVKVGATTCATPVVTATKITCTIPKLAAGSSDGPEAVVVTNSGVNSVLSATSIYTYLSR